MELWNQVVRVSAVALMAFASFGVVAQSVTNGPAAQDRVGRIFDGQHFGPGERVVTAGNSYRKCEFEGCIGVFSNASFEFSPDCRFRNCKWEVRFEGAFGDAEAADFERLLQIEGVIIRAEFQAPKVSVVLPAKPRGVRLGFAYKRALLFSVERRVVGQAAWTNLTPLGGVTPAVVSEASDPMRGLRVFLDQTAEPSKMHEYRVRAGDGAGDFTDGGPPSGQIVVPGH